MSLFFSFFNRRPWPDAAVVPWSWSPNYYRARGPHPQTPHWSVQKEERRGVKSYTVSKRFE